MASRLLAVTLLLGPVVAHFNLLYPATIGFSDDTQHDGPCGGFVPDFAKNNITDFCISGDAISTKTTHPQGNWLYRVTLSESASGNWTQIFPIVEQTGLGAFCEPSVAVPKQFSGKQGVLSVVSSTPDGVLFQCAAVKFVEGTAKPPQVCSNNSIVTAKFSADSKLDALIGNVTTDSTDKGNNSTKQNAATVNTPSQILSVGIISTLALLFSFVLLQ